MILIGKIAGTFGNKGDVKILSLLSPPDILLEVEEIYIDNELGNKQKIKVTNAKRHKNIFIFSLEGINDMNVAESLKDYNVYVPNLDFIELEDNEFFFHDLIGMNVSSDDGLPLGKVDHILKGGNDILVIKNENGEEIMIPFVDELVPEVNLEDKTIVVNLLEGMK